MPFRMLSALESSSAGGDAKSGSPRAPSRIARAAGREDEKETNRFTSVVLAAVTIGTTGRWLQAWKYINKKKIGTHFQAYLHNISPRGLSQASFA